jgi:hypothetical protein
MLMSTEKLGRPAKVDQEVVRKLEDSFMHGATVTEACYISGISRDTFYRRLQEDTVFSDKMERARNWLRTVAKRNIANAVKGGDIKVSLWLLERHDTLPRQGVADEMPEEHSEENLKRFKETLEEHIKQKVALELRKNA